MQSCSVVSAAKLNRSSRFSASGEDWPLKEDDRRFFPPYDAAPLVRLDALERFPELGPILDFDEDAGGGTPAPTIGAQGLNTSLHDIETVASYVEA